VREGDEKGMYKFYYLNHKSDKNVFVNNRKPERSQLDSKFTIVIHTT
jgi:hypothetical protein